MDWNIPNPHGQPTTVSLNAGARIFIVGANGSGKSALLQNFVSNNRDKNIRLIVAHRPTAFRTEKISSQFQDREQAEQQIKNREINSDYRWKEDHAIQHEIQFIALSELVSRENALARLVCELVRNDKLDEAKRDSTYSRSPFGKINDLFSSANLGVSLTLSDGGDILAVRQDTNESYNMAHMSDGERNAAIIAATVLTVESGTILLIDEPERHLHKSIVVPFLSALFREREDCIFILSTHEINLPSADASALVMLVRSCKWENSKAASWEIQLLNSDAKIPEDLKRDILGSREKIVFVEGIEGSLDKRLYTVLFPNMSVIAKGNCIDVERAVTGLRETLELHHIETFGLIDRDDRENQEIQKLAEKYIFALDVCTVESLYCNSVVVEAAARRQAESLGCNYKEIFQNAIDEALSILSDDEVRAQMSARRCQGKIRNMFASGLPTWKMVLERNSIENVVETAEVNRLFDEELSIYDELLSDRDYDGLVARYPLHFSNLRNRIAQTLRCKDEEDYLRLVVSRVRVSEGLSKTLRTQMGQSCQQIFDQ